ncbi:MULTISPECIES: hypothetical protein [Sphingobacterium]|uniref:hypothetical protein n=1 Tax=Sphingobacterium TaxID=28453 RepID=UPI00069235F6|nr:MULTISPECIES: hypothetical protein [Sphingobacterium]MDH5828455.1 thiamine diphosphokinase [Sphingobacterium faecium]
MSSHHIVRERQEPALLITDIYSIDIDLVGQILEWSPTIITDIDSYEAVTSQNYKVDVIFTNKLIDLPQEHVKSVFFETNYVEAALRYLVQEGYSAVNILGGGFDKTVLEQFAKKIDIVWLRDDKRTIFVQSGFQKWMPAGDELIIESTLNELELEGVALISENKYKTIKDGFFKIKFSNSKFCLLTEKI